MSNEEQAAWDELDRLTSGSPGKLWRWSIPADPERDSDLILSAGLNTLANERDAAYAAINAMRAHLVAAELDGSFSVGTGTIYRELNVIFHGGEPTP